MLIFVGDKVIIRSVYNFVRIFGKFLKTLNTLINKIKFNIFINDIVTVSISSLGNFLNFIGKNVGFYAKKVDSPFLISFFVPIIFPMNISK